jgi:glutaredoxin
MPAHVTLYSRARCHLCDLAREAIASSNCADQYVLEEIDIDGDESLRERYTNDVPVVAIDGVDTFWHHVDAAAFRRLVSSAAGADGAQS